MSKKQDIKKLISNLKKASKNKVVPTTMGDALTRAFVHPAFRERDMREEAKSMGAHGATEYFGGK